jgi:hypothetical protein
MDLPDKSSKHVAWWFFWLSNLIGYPLVLQADNGSEFKGDVKELLEDVKNLTCSV